METDSKQVIVSSGATSQATQIHHRDFPEIRAHGESEREAAEQLVNQLTRALDSALTTWRRQTIETAIADVRAFLENTP
jgi:hypothetical protein